jgi:hypothetical protein
VVPLDDRRRWYRYHHLFADVLRARILDEQPERVPQLHRRASAWYERNGEPSEAIRHALAAYDFAKAADLIELAAPALRRSRQEGGLLGWLGAARPTVARDSRSSATGARCRANPHQSADSVAARIRTDSSHVHHDDLPASARPPGAPWPGPWPTGRSLGRAATSSRIRTVRAEVYASPGTDAVTVLHRHGTATTRRLSGRHGLHGAWADPLRCCVVVQARLGEVSRAGALGMAICLERA